MSQLEINPSNVDQNYWETRWQLQQTGWDIGYASPAITDFFDQVEDKELSILIPGCGNAHEAEYLLKKGFKNITLVDIAPKAIEVLKNKFRNDPQIQAIHGDFFDLEGHYDLMVEQTFFCALPPALRSSYVKKASQLLGNSGKIVGLMFNKPFEKQGPPFGGDVEEYRDLFSPYFGLEKMENCQNSIPKREGNELFVVFNSIGKIK